MNLDTPVGKVKGIGEKKARLLAKLNIETVADLLYYMPRGYESAGRGAKICDLADGEVCHITAIIHEEPKLRRVKSGLNLTTFSLSDETGRVEAVFFNQPYIKNMYRLHDTVYVSGSVKRVGRRLQFTNPHMEKNGGQREGLNPVYPLTAGISQKVMRMVVKSLLDALGGKLSDPFTADFRSCHGLCEINFALEQIHFPADEEALELAKRRLIFEELLLFNIALSGRESAAQEGAVRLPLVSANVMNSCGGSVTGPPARSCA